MENIATLHPERKPSSSTASAPVTIVSTPAQKSKLLESSAPGNPYRALQHSDRRSLRRVDQTFCLLSSIESGSRGLLFYRLGTTGHPSRAFDVYRRHKQTEIVTK